MDARISPAEYRWRLEPYPRNLAAAVRYSNPFHRAEEGRCALLTKTILGMVIHQTDGLHKGIANCRTHKLEAACQQVTAQRIRFRSPRRHLAEGLPLVYA